MATSSNAHKIDRMKSTGNRALDELLDAAPPQVLAAAYAVSKLAYHCGKWNGLLWDVLEDRVRPLREEFGHDPSDDSPDELFVPRWLGFADGVQVGFEIEK